MGVRGNGDPVEILLRHGEMVQLGHWLDLTAQGHRVGRSRGEKGMSGRSQRPPGRLRGDLELGLGPGALRGGR